MASKVKSRSNKILKNLDRKNRSKFFNPNPSNSEEMIAKLQNQNKKLSKEVEKLRQVMH